MHRHVVVDIHIAHQGTCLKQQQQRRIRKGLTSRTIGSNSMLLPVPLLRTGVACCLPTCSQVFFRSWYGGCGEGKFWGFLFFPLRFVHPGVLALLVIHLVCTRLGSQVCASCWTRPSGGGLWEHYLCYPSGICRTAQYTACQICEEICGVYAVKQYMLASVGQPGLHSYNACMVYWTEGASRRSCRQKQGETSFSPTRVFCLVGISGYGFGV